MFRGVWPSGDRVAAGVGGFQPAGPADGEIVSLKFLVRRLLPPEPIDLSVDAVFHPLLEDSPSFPIASRLLPEGAGGMMAFELKGGRESVQRMLSRFRLASFAASLGGVETTISYPEITSHRGLTPEERAQLGVGPGTVRVSVGIEAAEDILADFTQALS